MVKKSERRLTGISNGDGKRKQAATPETQQTPTTDEALEAVFEEETEKASRKWK